MRDGFLKVRQQNCDYFPFCIGSLTDRLEPHLVSVNKNSKTYEYPMCTFEKDLLTVMLKSIHYNWVPAKAQLILSPYHGWTSTK